MSQWKAVCQVEDIPVLGSRRVARANGPEVALFRNAEEDAAAVGHFVHVYVDRETKRPVAVDDKMRGFLESLKT